MTDISRYSEDAAATFNAGLQSLEDLYLRIGNNTEQIAAGTLESATDIIDLPVSSSTWRCVRLMTNLLEDTGVETSYDLYANYSRSNVYGYTVLGVTTLVGSGATINTSRIPQPISVTYPAFVDAWICFNALGFLLSSSVSQYAGGNINHYRYGGYGMVGAVSSLQISISGTFAAGGTYILEGIRA